MEEIVTDTVDSGVIEDVQLAPIGKYTGSDAEGNPVDETLDAESLQAIADKLNEEEAEILADVDHGASKPGLERDTRAAGWFSRFFVDPIKGLFARLRLTKKGRELVENREYRYLSPVFTLGADGRPVDLHAASLTNTPAFGGSIAPVLNQAPGNEGDFQKGIEDMTKEELVELIKETVKAMKADETALDQTCGKETAENQEPSEELKEEVVEEIKEEVKEEAAEEPKAEEPKEEPKAEDPEEEVKEEVKEEVIKLEALNQAPKPLQPQAPKWAGMSRNEFIKWFNAGNR